MAYFNVHIEVLVGRLRNFKRVLRDELYRIIMENEEVVTKMVSEDQLYERGIDGRGVEIWSYKPYKVQTQMIKIENGQPYDRVTLRDTGAFHKSFFVDLLGDGFRVSATDPKTYELTAKYGDGIFRLTNENVLKLLDNYIRPELKPRMRNYLRNGY